MEICCYNSGKINIVEDVNPLIMSNTVKMQ